MLRRIQRAIAAVCATVLLVAPAAAQRFDPGPPQAIAPGVTLYHVTDQALLDPAAPVSVWLLRLDPARTRLRSSLANDEIMGTETVAGIAERHQALAAINAGFFLPNGDPAGALTLDGQLVSDTQRPRGAVGIVESEPGQQLLFARLRASIVLEIGARTSDRIPIDGVDTTRARGKLMLFTPAYHSDTDTAAGGREWILDGHPLKVRGASRVAGKTPIPPNGYVLSYGGTSTPERLRRLRNGTRVALTTTYEAIEGPSDIWLKARDIVGGAGLLVRDGRAIDDWTIEQFARGFAETRHPRTMIGTTSDGTIWLVTVDGRQPQLSAGMTLAELRALASRLDLVNALNLDGGGSTTMWVRGKILNSPSDTAGPRKVSDALLVFSAPVAGDRL
jgi:Phosphodiester glycosidase